jgi:hypothetical protein
MFEKTGSAVALMQPTTVDQWNNHKTASQPSEEIREIISAVDDDCIYLHGTILASVDLEPDHEYYIKPECEDFINDNGDAFPRQEVLNRYQTFKTHARTYAEHKQGPEFAKGRCIDVVVRNMGDTVLVDVLFTVDKEHKELIRNITKQIVTHLSMGCQTEYTKCSFCGKVAHNEEEYCDHVKNSKRQKIADDNGKMRKVAELCYNNTWIDVSLVMNPAFGGAAIRKILSKDEVGKQVLASILSKYVETENNEISYEDVLRKVASTMAGDFIQHPITNTISNDIYPPEGYKDIPWSSPHDVKDEFDACNSGNESRVEGPITNLQNVADGLFCCDKCSSTKANLKVEHNGAVVKCGACNYIHEIEMPKLKVSSDNLTITTTGNVGLGTTNPTAVLHIPSDTLHVAVDSNPSQTKEESIKIGDDKTATRKQVLDIVSDLVKNVKSKFIPLEDVLKEAGNYKFLQKEILDSLTSQGYKVASKTAFKNTISEIISGLYSYQNANDLQKISSMMTSFNIDSSLLDQAIQQYDNIDISEDLIHKSLISVDSLCKEENIQAGIAAYIEKVYDRWDHKDISEMIYDMYPAEATEILDTMRQMHYK